VKQYLLAVLVLLLLCPALGRAQSDPVVRGGSAVYPGLEVNLEGGDGLRRLQIAFEAQCVDEKGAQLATSPQAVEAVLLALRGKTAAELSTPRGREKLKPDLVRALNAAIGSPRVVQVLFLQFVIF
jgi:flagellar protein FliL